MRPATAADSAAQFDTSLFKVEYINCQSATISANPNNATVVEGQTANYTVTAGGSSPTYQWEISTDSGSSWNPVNGGTGVNNGTDGTGGTTASFTSIATTAAMNDYRYRCVAAVACGGGSTATSTGGTLTVTSCTTAGVVTPPSNQSVAAGATVTFSVVASGSAPAYQWQVSTDSGGTWNNVSGGTGATTASYTTPVTLGADHGKQFRCVVSVACDSSSVESDAATLTVSCTPASVTDPADKAALAGSTATFTATGGGSPTLSYQWQESADNGSTWNNVTTGTGGTTASYTTAATTPGDDGTQYHCIVTSDCDSSADTSAAATLTVVDPAIALFRSVASGNWGASATWEASANNGSTWLPSGSAPTDVNNVGITIRNGHTVTVNAATTADQVVVAAGGQLAVNGAALTIADDAGTPYDMDVAGTLVIDSNHPLAGGGAIRFTGTYRWSAASATPTIPTATWADDSVCVIEDTSNSGDGNTTGISGQSFYDLQVNHPGYARRLRLNFLGGTTTVIRNDFTVSVPDVASASVGLGDGVNVVVEVGGDVTFTTGSTANTTKVLLKRANGDSFTMRMGGNLAISGVLDCYGGSPELALFEFNGSGAQSVTIPTGANYINGYRLTYQVNSGSVVTLGSPIEDSAGIIVNGTLGCGANAVAITTGGSLIGAGTLNSTGVFAAAGNYSIQPGNAGLGTLTFGNDLTLAATVVVEISSPSSADNLDVTGTLTLGGTLTVVNIGGALTNGDTFNLFDGTLVGAFGTLNLPHGPAHWNTSGLDAAGSGQIAFINNDPIAAHLTIGVAAGGTATVDLFGKYANNPDVDGDTVTVTDASGAVNGTAGFTSTSVSYTNTAGSSDSFSYTVSDGLGGTTTRTVTVEIYSAEGFNKLSGPVANGSNWDFSYLGIPGEDYALEEAAQLVAPYTWEPVVTNTASGTGALDFNGLTLSHPSGSFRTRHVP